MDYIFDDWKKILTDFQNSVSKDLEEIHKQKDEVQKMKNDVFNHLDSGRYVRDDRRLVLSAPEIIIGNVSKSGDLLGGGTVVIRGSNVNMEGVGKTGAITARATQILQTAVDPGIDGNENAVYPHSSIVSQARSLTLQSNNATDAFSSVPPIVSESGIHIHADKKINISASLSAAYRKKELEDRVSQLKKQKDELKKATDSQKSTIDKLMSDLKKLMEEEDKINGDPIIIRMNTVSVEELHQQINVLLPSLYRSMSDFIHTVSQQAEVSRMVNALEAEKGAIPADADFKKKPTGASLSVTAENIMVQTRDGDGNLLTNDASGISVITPRMGVSMSQDNGPLVKNSYFRVQTENVNISTSNPADDGKEIPAEGTVLIASKDVRIESMDYQKKDKKYTEKGLAADGRVAIVAKTIEVDTTNPANIERDDKAKVTKGEYKAEGDIVLRAKNVAVETLDYEVKDGKLSPKTLTQGSAIAIRSESMSMLAADTEGKATGSISINAKAVSVKSMDVDKEKLEDKSLAEGSTMLLLSEKMYVGAKDKSNKSKKVQAVSEEMGLFADKTFEAQQGDGKAVVQLEGGNAAVSGSKTQLYGATTVNAKMEVKDEVKAPKATIDNIEAKSSFKSPNISDGVAVPASGGAGSLSTKLKTEDVK